MPPKTTNPSSTENKERQSDLDLDTLERHLTDYDEAESGARSGDASEYLGQILLAIPVIIQRLREAEAETRATYSDWHKDIHRYEARIAQLKQVREAARKVPEALNWIENAADQPWHEGVIAVFNELESALAAVEEP